MASTGINALAHCAAGIDNRQYLGQTRFVTTTLPLIEAPVCCEPITDALLSAEQAEELAALLKAIAEPTRLRLLSLIAAQPHQEACVCDLTEPVGLSQPTVSHHLKILVDAGLLTRDKRGVWAYYQLVPSRLAQLTQSLVGRPHGS